MRSEFLNKLQNEGAGRDPVLTESVEKNGIVGFMRALARNGVVDGIDRQRFESLWGVTENRTWLKDRLRAAAPYSNPHEWIPCDLIPDVIERASTPGTYIDAGGWIDAQHQIRCETQGIIYLPNVHGLRVPGSGKIALSGHVGALYIVDPNNAERLISSTTGQGPWHDRLHDAFDRSPTVAQLIDNLEQTFTETVWNGEESTLGVSLDDLVTEYFSSQSFDDDLEWQNLCAGQRSFYSRIRSLFPGWRRSLT